VLAIAPGWTIARFSEDESAVKIPMGKVRAEDGDGERAGEEAGDKGRGCNFDLGYAVTVHKMQGSEAPLVVCVVDVNAGRVASREFWYTALSRATKLCVVVGPRATMERQAKRVSLKRRKTFLTEMLKDQLAPCAIPAH
jgi:ATP-dependent exoDNAse (exonuclease V) alpha subunit